MVREGSTRRERLWRLGRADLLGRHREKPRVLARRNSCPPGGWPPVESCAGQKPLGGQPSCGVDGRPLRQLGGLVAVPRAQSQARHPRLGLGGRHVLHDMGGLLEEVFARWRRVRKLHIRTRKAREAGASGGSDSHALGGVAGGCKRSRCHAFACACKRSEGASERHAFGAFASVCKRSEHHALGAFARVCKRSEHHALGGVASAFKPSESSQRTSRQPWRQC
mmetsp:Transcript_76609/g.212853  ORF Transcript_76609/g.212853 Transcript_76609/m.212853 type:complete len:223 (-) Transcript_76609:595-1263(-)